MKTQIVVRLIKKPSLVYCVQEYETRKPDSIVVDMAEAAVA